MPDRWTDERTQNLRLDCPTCWVSLCSAHGPIAPSTKVRVLLADYRHLAARFEEARLNLARTLGMPQDTEMIDLVTEVRDRLLQPPPSPHTGPRVWALPEPPESRETKVRSHAGEVWRVCPDDVWETNWDATETEALYGRAEWVDLVKQEGPLTEVLPNGD